MTEAEQEHFTGLVQLQETLRKRVVGETEPKLLKATQLRLAEVTGELVKFISDRDSITINTMMTY